MQQAAQQLTACKAYHLYSGELERNQLERGSGCHKRKLHDRQSLNLVIDVSKQLLSMALHGMTWHSMAWRCYGHTVS